MALGDPASCERAAKYFKWLLHCILHTYKDYNNVTMTTGLCKKGTNLFFLNTGVLNMCWACDLTASRQHEGLGP